MKTIPNHSEIGIAFCCCCCCWCCCLLFLHIDLLLLIIIHKGNFVPREHSILNWGYWMCVVFFRVFAWRCPHCTCYKFGIGTDCDNSLQTKMNIGHWIATNETRKKTNKLWSLNFELWIFYWNIWPAFIISFVIQHYPYLISNRFWEDDRQLFNGFRENSIPDVSRLFVKFFFVFVE